MAKLGKTMDKIRQNDGGVDFTLGVVLIREGANIAAYIPALDLTTHGDTEDDALKAAEEAASLFLDGIHSLGTFHNVLVNLGWQIDMTDEDDGALIPPEVINAMHSVRVSCHD